MSEGETFDLPAGIFKGTITEWNVIETQNGKDAVEFTVLLEKYLNQDGTVEELPADDLKATVTKYITDATIPYLVPQLRQLGYTQDGIDGLDPNSETPHNFGGKVVEVRLKKEVYKEKPVDRWEFHFGAKPATKAKVSSLAAKYNAAFKANPGGVPVTAATAAAKPSANGQAAADTKSQADEIF